MERKWLLPGSILWIVGLVMSIVGLNMEGNTGSWVSVIGNILFFLGVALVGVAWFLKNRKQTPAEEKNRE